MRWAGHVAYIAEKRNAYRDLVGEAESNVSLGRSKHRYVYNIKIDLKERLWEVMGWINIV
jgi:hypothetical protein